MLLTHNLSFQRAEGRVSIAALRPVAQCAPVSRPGELSRYVVASIPLKCVCNRPPHFRGCCGYFRPVRSADHGWFGANFAVRYRILKVFKLQVIIFMATGVIGMNHVLTIESDGHWFCSCGQWNDKLLGKIGSEYMQKNGITEAVIQRWHSSHSNAIILEIR